MLTAVANSRTEVRGRNVKDAGRALDDRVCQREREMDNIPGRREVVKLQLENVGHELVAQGDRDL